ncbi:MAG: hypothetical protein A2275_13335 [Bacteroidetes bacterium RIFOXYA12_FULL_35_11]|nr:MAG: hypothetical protein A2X01_17405 [Bacteroidetes bacterium GWF2_35_48]OFY81651.1 MAG: hypothetical protein A2275_13335 [Bacteroidetes bacterium RIFOXYA12_FULL_35_11]OFY92526.1 MAG: hypothetical protein A2309_04190 [Bacteroidetes bacterium RIFOXYB2_FULL_35_7]OFY95462.1 MAG: hypothetical protein A2491_11355 [Bacteroidetes bacterium RIFOXYC12_FULL_35_7]HBX52984.1 hypothetical protein [Bacteroidales bacterium]
MEESRKIKFSLGNVSLDKNLGSYYIDMRPALIHYTTNNIYNGVIDPNGVPMCRNNKELYYSTVNIAQYGFMLHAEWLENRDQKTLQILKHCLLVLNNLKTTKNNTSVWYNYVFDEKYKIDPPWPSAMAQGEIISFYLRMYQALNDENLLNTAIQAYEFLKFEYNNGGVRRFDEYGDLWFEEYPTPKPTFVLNGYIYTLFGLYDLYRVTGNTEVKKDIDKCIITLKKNIHKFSTSYWSIYDLLNKELVRYYYQQNVHVPQLKILYYLTEEPIFKKYYQKWKKQITPLNFLFVKLMFRVKPRIRNLKKMIDDFYKSK